MLPEDLAPLRLDTEDDRERQQFLVQPHDRGAVRGVDPLAPWGLCSMDAVGLRPSRR